ncbi:hypothetical protein ACWEJ6_47465 [Nonomuraea sp. NPDC004702]
MVLVLGIAIASSVAFASTTGADAEGLNDGFQAGFLATAVFALAGLATALLLLLHRDRKTSAQSTGKHSVPVHH